MIGVILMVAITVILAAVIAAFVLDIGGGLDEQPQAGVDIDGDGTTDVTVTLTDTGNSDGVAIVDDTGEVYSDDLDATGAQVNIDDSDDGDYTVQAYFGEVSSGEDIDDAAQANAIIGDFTVEDA
ncbi:hypothetical protein C446_17926 [Halobiforma nitratireducens JCM 10879]|uniref:Archaeal Type IV pilin N-terminal domain-containing protein n=1 Tax=Halobiforma nitratireducens JCM 10879 TaxID=1227454 RepID=M0L173_9EURY|nr:hypothetical protein C446_17926 [Halobiforma nitratireducens JCM 10879]